METSIVNQFKTEFQLRKKETIAYLSYLLHNQSSLSKHRFIILAQYRTGSSLLADLLNSHPDIFADKEIFFPFAISSRLKKVLFPYAYINGQLIESNSKIYGFDLKIDQLILSLSERFHITPIQLIEKLHLNNWKIIYLKRNNTLRKAISSMCCNIRKQYTNTDETPLVRKRVYIDCRKLKKQLRWFEKIDREEEIIIQKIPCLSVNYENDLLNSEQHQLTLDRIFNYLGTYSVPVNSKLRRVSTHNFADDIENHEEVIDFIQKTKYQKFLELN